VDGEELEVVADFSFLGALVTGVFRNWTRGWAYKGAGGRKWKAEWFLEFKLNLLYVIQQLK